ncbi:hypothetical protein GCM10020258_43950 [Sphingomonas yabuuchiae]
MNMHDAALVDRFLEMMAAEAGAAGNTLAAYRSDLRLAAEAMDGLREADEGALQRLAEGWASLANSTVARKAAALRRFYAFLHEEGLRGDDPSSVLPRPGQRRALPKILSHADIDRLFAAITERTGPRIPAQTICASRPWSSCSMVRAFVRANWSPCRAMRCTRTAPS